MDDIKIIFKEGGLSLLPDISYERFKEFMFKSGGSDVEYEKYLREKGMMDLSDLNSETTCEIVLLVEQKWRGRVLRFKCTYDSDDDPSFDAEEYFATNDPNVEQQ